jgi:hypothetical protein
MTSASIPGAPTQTAGPTLAGGRNASRPLLSAAWRRIKDFCGLDNDATYLWPRWLVLRSVGLLFVVIFADIIVESPALIGPRGLAPLPGLVAQLRAAAPGAVAAFLKAPTLFAFNASPGMVLLLEWGGLAAALALVLNLWPRMALFTCWVSLLSFANGWVIFSDPQVDWLILEVTLLCLPFAPAGYRPGLGTPSPPRPIAFFMMRWLLFRVMFENGLSKVIFADPRWYHLTVMDDLYQTAPCPTILGYLDHQLPHFWHVGEIGLTFAAELLAPLLAIFGGRRGRWCAFGLWTVFQAGIQATCNFGWLNTASIALGLLLLDDQMLARAAGFLRLPRLASRLIAPGAAQVTPVIGPWSRYGLRAALGTHFYLTVVFFIVLSCKVPENAFFAAVNRPLRTLFQGLGSVNAYGLFAWLAPTHRVVEFTGSNDGGRTWRTYDYRYFPQREDHIPPFIAPRFPRFEAALQIEVNTRDQPTALYGLTADRLLQRSPAVMGLFEQDPFADRPPQMIRLQVFDLSFTNLATYRTTRRYWNRHYAGEYAPLKYLTPAGEIREASTVFDQLYVKAAYGNPQAQNSLGFLYISGEEGVTKDSAEAVKWYTAAAEQGVPGAQLNLALIYANGDGVTKDLVTAARWCRRAAEQGLPEAQDRLGIMYYEGLGMEPDGPQALVWFNVSALAGLAEAAQHRTAVEARLGPTAARAARQRGQALFTEIEARKKKP